TPALAPSTPTVASPAPAPSAAPAAPTAPATGATAGPPAAPAANPAQELPQWLLVLLGAGPVAAVLLYLAARRARRP
ncbi:MAG: hypothetical protein Q8O07_08290, partial [Chloroflexota bacterium]|nr:hypothetical protein [Chloroflexota bacterium]